MILVQNCAAILRCARTLAPSIAEHRVRLSLGPCHLLELFLDFLLLSQTQRASAPLEWKLEGRLLHSWLLLLVLLLLLGLLFDSSIVVLRPWLLELGRRQWRRGSSLTIEDATHASRREVLLHDLL